MNDEELNYLRDLHAGFAMIGLIMKGEEPHNIPMKAYLYADEMQQARDLHSAGIASIKRQTKKEKAYE